MCENFGNSGGERGGGVNFEGRFWKIQRGGGVIRQILSGGGGGGMDIFWNHTLEFTHEFKGVKSRKLFTVF